MIQKLKSIMVGTEVFLEQWKILSKKKEMKAIDDQNHKLNLRRNVVSEEKKKRKENQQ